MLGPENLVAEAVGNVHLLRSVEGHAPGRVDVKIGVVLRDDGIFGDGFAQFLRGIGAAGDDGIGKYPSLRAWRRCSGGRVERPDRRRGREEADRGPGRVAMRANAGPDQTCRKERCYGEKAPSSPAEGTQIERGLHDRALPSVYGDLRSG